MNQMNGWALWRVCGQESHGSSGGRCVLYVLTDGPTALPDPNAAAEALIRDASFYMIEEVTLMGQMPSDPAHKPYGGWAEDVVHDQRTSRLLPGRWLRAD